MGHIRSQKLVYDPHYGAASRRACTTTSRRRSSTSRPTPSGRAVGLPDPSNPIGAKGIGEPSTVAAAGAVLCALADAVGDDIIRRTPVQPERSLPRSLANGRKPMTNRFTAFI